MIYRSLYQIKLPTRVKNYLVFKQKVYLSQFPQEKYEEMAVSLEKLIE